MDRGSWIVDREAGWIMDCGSWIVALCGSWIMDRGSEAHGPRLDAKTSIYIIDYMIKQRFREPRRFPTIWLRIVDRGMGWLGSWIVALGGPWIMDRG